jgi:hypothetical protein
MTNLLVKLPPIGVEATHIPSGITGVVGKWDLTHPSGTPYVRLDHRGIFDWVPVREVTWPHDDV